MGANQSNPCVYELNTRILLNELSQEQQSKRLTLDDLPDDWFDRFKGKYEYLWFVGLWKTGAASKEVSRYHESWQESYVTSLPDLKRRPKDPAEEDIVGSPFAIVEYTLNERFGTATSLSTLRRRLNDRGIKLLLEFEPNHTALDHAWVNEHPEYYVKGNEQLLAEKPDSFFQPEGSEHIFAHGKNPSYEESWPDTVQLNYRHGGCRQEMINQLLKIAEQCDGVRCDMAMLSLPDIFVHTWPDQLSYPRDGSHPVDSPFWRDAIHQVKQKFPNFVFIAEVYWGREQELQQLGFDFTYDKSLYDQLREKDINGIKQSLSRDKNVQRQLVRFIENHDEPRAASVFSDIEWYQAAALIALLSPGMKLIHDGQIEGRSIPVSIHLARRRKEPVNEAISNFYTMLFDTLLTRYDVHKGEWSLLGVREGWAENATFQNFICFAFWHTLDPQAPVLDDNTAAPYKPVQSPLLICINYSPLKSQCYVNMSIFAEYIHDKKVILTDVRNPQTAYERNGNDLAFSRGLFLEMSGWGYHVFEMKLATLK